MLNLLRFLSFVLFCLGLSLLVAYLIRRIYHHFNLQALLNKFDPIFDEAFRLMLTFRKYLFSDDRDNARTFLVSELKRSRLELPRRYRGFYDLLIRSAFTAIERRQTLLEEKPELLNREVKEEIRKVMIRSYEQRSEYQSLQWMAKVVPCVFAASAFFPLLIYFEFPTLLHGPFWIFAVIGAVVLTLAIRFILRDWTR